MNDELQKLFKDTLQTSDSDMGGIEERLKKIRIKLNKKIFEDPYPHTFDGVCPICLESNEGWCILRYCKHVYHCKCITEWYNTRISSNLIPRCPKCNEFYFLDDIIPKKPFFYQQVWTRTQIGFYVNV